jgi:hypothetical protein
MGEAGRCLGSTTGLAVSLHRMTDSSLIFIHRPQALGREVV